MTFVGAAESSQVGGGCWLSLSVICCLISFSSASSGSSDRFRLPYVDVEEDGDDCGNCDDLRRDAQFQRFRRPELDSSDSNDDC